MTEEELIEDVECLGGLVRMQERPPEPVKQSLVQTFAYPEQETKLRVGKKCKRTDTRAYAGEIVALDEEARTIGLKISKKQVVPAKLSIGPEGPIGIDSLREAVWRFADSIEQGDERFAAVRALLRKDAPVFRGRAQGSAVLAVRGDRFAEALDAVLALDDSYLFVQGPPGTGKTTMGSRLIVGLLKAGKRVGVTSNSHKVINNLLLAVERRADEQHFVFAGAKKSNENDPTRVRRQIHVDVYNNDIIGSLDPLIAVRRGSSPIRLRRASTIFRRRGRTGRTGEPRGNGYGGAEHRAAR
jgi:uncharacterized protein